jgi:hypothetical protein
MGVLDQEGHLSMITFDPVVSADRDHLIAESEDERHPIRVVDLGEPLDIAIS